MRTYLITYQRTGSDAYCIELRGMFRFVIWFLRHVSTLTFLTFIVGVNGVYD